MSTIKSSAEDLTLNADGSNEIKFQINAVEKASISSAGLLTSTTIDATALTGNLPAIDGSSLTGISAGTALTGSTNNTIPTVTGANAISGEANLTFDGTDLTLGAGDIVFGTAGKGICLGVTSNTDANTLDDYEEGTWTAALDGTTASSIFNSTGKYTKIGNVVYFTWNSGAMTLASSTGSARVTGLPFAATGMGTNDYVLFIYGHGNAVDGNSIGGYIGNGADYLAFIDAGDTETATFINGSSKYMQVSGFYYT